MNRVAPDAGWILIGALAVGGLFFWPLLVIAGCAAVSRRRGPNHYTKFMVPYAYRFKWDPGWILVAVLAALGGLGALVGDGFPWFLLLAGFIALMRVVIWLCFRFPLMSWFFVMFIIFLFGIGLRFRFWV